jgi:hypothetical protein
MRCCPGFNQPRKHELTHRYRSGMCLSRACSREILCLRLTPPLSTEKRFTTRGVSDAMEGQPTETAPTRCSCMCVPRDCPARKYKSNQMGFSGGRSHLGRDLCPPLDFDSRRPTVGMWSITCERSRMISHRHVSTAGLACRARPVQRGRSHPECVSGTSQNFVGRTTLKICLLSAMWKTAAHFEDNWQAHFQDSEYYADR